MILSKLFKVDLLRINMYNKRGQFYLIAAVIIVIILMVLASSINYVKKDNPRIKVYELSQELKGESAKVIDYGVYQGEDIPWRIDNFTKEYFSKYADEKEPNSEIAFIYGDYDKVKFSAYTKEDSGSINFYLGESRIGLVKTEGSKWIDKEEDNPRDNTLIVNLGANYTFKLNDGENFFFVIKKGIGEDNYVGSN